MTKKWRDIKRKRHYHPASEDERRSWFSLAGLMYNRSYLDIFPLMDPLKVGSIIKTKEYKWGDFSFIYDIKSHVGIILDCKYIHNDYPPDIKYGYEYTVLIGDEKVLVRWGNKKKQEFFYIIKYV